LVEYAIALTAGLEPGYFTLDRGATLPFVFVSVSAVTEVRTLDLLLGKQAR
jgi:hypothetical protein